MQNSKTKNKAGIQGCWQQVLHSSLQKQLQHPCVSILKPMQVSFHTILQMPNGDAQHSCPGHKTCFLAQCCSEITAAAALCHHSHTYASLPFIQVCKCPTVMHSTVAQDTKHALWLRVALQNSCSILVSPQSRLCKLPFI